MKNIITLIFVGFISLPTLFAQFTDSQIEEFVETASKKNLIKRNTTLIMNGYYYQSSIVADKLIELEPDNANFNYRKGYAAFQKSVDHNLAKPFFRKAVLNVSKEYDPYSNKEETAPIDAYFYLGRCFHLNKEIADARIYYKKFLEAADGGESELTEDAKRFLKHCDVAEEMLDTPKNYEVVNLGSEINTEYPEYAPVVSLDGQSLYFTSRRLRADSSNADIKEPFTNMYLEDVYVSNIDADGNWGEARILDFCLPERNEASIGVSSDERRVYIYRDDVGNGDIFYTEFEDNKFQELVPIDAEHVNSDAWEPHITVSVDGRSKYFVSDREGGFGGRDIYRVVKLPNGEWSKPQNLGEKINTPYDEDAPFLAIDNKTLYFSSNGPNSMGGFDVFVSVIDDEGEWSDPINLGYPLNSVNDDIYYTTTADGYTGYLSSFREGGRGEKDIYEIRNAYGLENIAVLKGTISVLDGQTIPDDFGFTLKCLNCEIDHERFIRPRLSDGAFLSSLQPCRIFEVVYHYGEDKTEIYKELIETDCDKSSQEIIRNYLLDVENKKFIFEEEEVEEVFTYNPIELKHYFGYNNNKLSTTEGALKDFVTEIKSQIAEGREELVVNVESSASHVPTRTYKNNENLAKLRADNIKSAIEDYVNANDGLKSKVSVEIIKTGVNGPAYKYGSAENISKYAPYQYIQLKVEGVSVDENTKTKSLNSNDKELDGKL